MYDRLELKLLNTTDPEIYDDIAKQVEMMKKDREQGW